jgi:hypothetical protein
MELQASAQKLLQAQRDRDQGATLAQSQIADLATQLDSLRRENQSITFLSEQREKDRRAMEESTSWRVTAPIRKVITWLRGWRAES